MVLFRRTRPAPVRRGRRRTLLLMLLTLLLARLLPCWLLLPRPRLHSCSLAGSAAAALPGLLRRWPAATTGQPGSVGSPSRRRSSRHAAGGCDGLGQRSCHRRRIQASCQRQCLQVVLDIQGCQLAAAVLSE